MIELAAAEAGRRGHGGGAASPSGVTRNGAGAHSSSTMSSTYARMRSTEAPMAGLEFTHRTNTVPAWRRDDDAPQQTPLKRALCVWRPVSVLHPSCFLYLVLLNSPMADTRGYRLT